MGSGVRLAPEQYSSPLARSIHERVCCDRGFAAATSLSAGLARRPVSRLLFKEALLPHSSGFSRRPVMNHAGEWRVFGTRHHRRRRARTPEVRWFPLW